MIQVNLYNDKGFADAKINCFSGTRIRPTIFFFLFLSLLPTSTNAQLQFNITDGQVAPTPIAIANFTNETGEISDVGKQIAQIISGDLESSGLFKPVDTAAFIAPHCSYGETQFCKLDTSRRERAAGRLSAIW